MKKYKPWPEDDVLTPGIYLLENEIEVICRSSKDSYAEIELKPLTELAKEVIMGFLQEFK